MMNTMRFMPLFYPDQDTQTRHDIYWMQQALQQAQQAADCDEVPVGAVLIDAHKQLLSSGFNQPIGNCDPTAHAEIIALRAAARHLGNYRLPGTTLYVTLEPCAMCIGALIQARVARIVYAALEPRTGAIESAHQLFESGAFNHRPEITGGVLAAPSRTLLQQFFRHKRTQKLLQ